MSISYGTEESYLSSSEMSAFNTQAIKLSAMGVTLVAASGDDGAISRRVRTSGLSACGYSSLFPASCPYVTAVGGTSVSTASPT
jgi:tripeptidyl-peptidase I